MEQNLKYHLIVTLPVYILLHTGLFGAFKKAGEAGWKAYVPVYNVYTWLQLVGRPKHWLIWFLIPVLNFIMGIGLILDMLRSYGKHKFIDQALAVIFPYFYFLYLGFNKKDKYQGKWASELAEDWEKDQKKQGKESKGQFREWADAILFAGTAAIIIRTFLIEAFMIPTTSMEGSLKAGDFLFVSKFHYGIRLPMVPIAFPFVHNTLPFTSGTKSYLPWIELPYSRLPGFRSISRDDIVVFNYPDDDEYPDVPQLGSIEQVSMKQNYIKRCVGVPGDSLKIVDQQIYIYENNAWKKGWNAEKIQFSYITTGANLNQLDELGIRTDFKDSNRDIEIDQTTGALIIKMDQETMEKVKAFPGVKIKPKKDSVGDVNQYIAFQRALLNRGDGKYVYFPKTPELYQWTQDEFGPIYIPKKGETVKLNSKVYPLYRKIIEVYEGNKLEKIGDKIIINGKEATEYTFQMDYYWMMGDNRHGSLDSRFWGYVPEDHVVGRPLMVLFSWDGGPRWSRFFKFISSLEP